MLMPPSVVTAAHTAAGSVTSAADQVAGGPSRARSRSRPGAHQHGAGDHAQREGALGGEVHLATVARPADGQRRT